MAKEKKYNEADLLAKIKEVANEHPEADITFGLLERETGIPKHIWRSPSYGKVRPLIERLNAKYNIHKELNKYPLMISNLIADVKAAPKDKVSDVLTDRMMMEQRLHQIACENVDKFEKCSKELSSCQEQLANAEAEIESLRSQLADCYIKSSVEPIRRKEKLKPSDKMLPQMTSLDEAKLGSLITGLFDD